MDYTIDGVEYHIDDEVVTDELRQKVHDLQSLKRQRIWVDSEIYTLKSQIENIKNRRRAANTAFDLAIKREKSGLKQRQLRKKLLTQELRKLKVNLLKSEVGYFVGKHKSDTWSHIIVKLVNLSCVSFGDKIQL